MELQELEKSDLVNISGGSEFTQWLARWWGSVAGSVAHSQPCNWECMEAQYGSNYMLWP